MQRLSSFLSPQTCAEFMLQNELLAVYKNINKGAQDAPKIQKTEHEIHILSEQVSNVFNQPSPGPVSLLKLMFKGCNQIWHKINQRIMLKSLLDKQKCSDQIINVLYSLIHTYRINVQFAKHLSCMYVLMNIPHL